MSRGEGAKEFRKTVNRGEVRRERCVLEGGAGRGGHTGREEREQARGEREQASGGKGEVESREAPGQKGVSRGREEVHQANQSTSTEQKNIHVHGHTWIYTHVHPGQRGGGRGVAEGRWEKRSRNQIALRSLGGTCVMMPA